MGIRFALARATAALSKAGLKYVFRRPAANFPGKIALYIDPQLIADLRTHVDASICVVGTNGKTTVTNVLADSFEMAGKSVICNRTGANLDSGVASALLSAPQADWGVFECDELWLAKILPGLRSNYVLLLNLFRDQLDRVGEIDHIQESIVGALSQSPQTVLVYNADDPLCQAIADAVDNPCVPFGLAQDMGLQQNIVADARMCQHCTTMLEYRWRQYGQLGDYHCPSCGFARTIPQFCAKNIDFGQTETTFTIESLDGVFQVHTALSGAYMVYNLLAVFTVAQLAHIDHTDVQKAIQAFNPQNGRLQNYVIDGRAILLNLAKNPTGFNQNLKIVMEGSGPKAVAFFINDKEADGHDVSWLWDIDFQELSAADDLVAFAGGMRKNDMQVRLKYAGVPSGLVEGAQDFLFKAAEALPDAKLYVIANYTALPSVKAELDKLAATCGEKNEMPEMAAVTAKDKMSQRDSFLSNDKAGGHKGASEQDQVSYDEQAPQKQIQAAPQTAQQTSESGNGMRIVIAHMYPTLLNLYGDGGNVIVLAERARQRGFDVEVRAIDQGDTVDFSDFDIVFLGGGPDREQHLASEELQKIAGDFKQYVEDDGVVLAICGGFQILGRTWLMGDESVPGLNLVGLTTKRAEGGSHNRLVGNIVLQSPLADHPVIGYENHAGRTYLDEGIEPFGRVLGSHGKGNNDTDKADGVLYRNVIGTYLHGPLLSKNPEIADHLLQKALQRKAARKNEQACELQQLDDFVEMAANAALCEKLNLR